MKSNEEVGSEFEKTVSIFYHSLGDYVDINRRIRGRSGVIHEIDIYVIKRGILGIRETAVECKYKSNGDRVSQEEVANFLVKLEDTGIGRGEFVTNSKFSNYARLLGSSHGLAMIDCGILKEIEERYRLDFHLEMRI